MDAMAPQISQIINLFGKCRCWPPIRDLWNIIGNQKYLSWAMIEKVILQCHTMSYHVNYLTNLMDLVYEWIKNKTRWVNTTYVFHRTSILNFFSTILRLCYDFVLSISQLYQKFDTFTKVSCKLCNMVSMSRITNTSQLKSLWILPQWLRNVQFTNVTCPYFVKYMKGCR
jgi:hypothetical protein